MSLMPTKQVEAIEFGLMTPDTIRKMSVARIITADTYDEDGLPITGGLMDGRLGTIEPGQRCKTCGNRVGECPGHFGHIELARPVIHVGYAKLIYKILRATCRQCSRLKLSEEEKKELRKRLHKTMKLFGQTETKVVDEVLKKARTETCPYCESKQNKIRLEKPTTFYEETEEGPKKLSSLEIREWLEKIHNEDCGLMGINPEKARPEWMIWTVLPVPPVVIRPSITLESGVRSEDDLTHKLVDIIRINQKLRENIEAGAPSLIVEDLWELLQYHATTLLDNEVSGIPPARHRSGRALRTLSQRLKGKEGRFRSNLSGKRVDFSARTVISPDPNLSINEVGIPEEVAKILTVPEKVTDWNIEALKRLVLAGPAEVEGANYVVRPDGRRIDLRFVRDKQTIADSLEPKYIIERHIKDGDLVLFNRQPSLHRMSIMAHMAKIMPHRTFRLNLCVCPPYNADFDGDEMNAHIPQGGEAKAEALELMLVQKQILSPRYGGPIIGAIQDYITSAFLLSKKDTFLKKKEACQLLLAAGYSGPLPPPEVAEPEPMWSGKQIVSLIIPKGLNMTLKANNCRHCETCEEENCPYDAYVKVKDGSLICGALDRKTLGAQQPKNMIHRIVKEFGSDEARRFLDSLGKLLIAFISRHGFSMGLRDIAVLKEAQERIRAIIEEKEKKVLALIKSFEKRELERLPGRTEEETLEMQIRQELSDARDTAGEVITSEYLNPKNPIAIMAKSGARGSALNLAQMIACVGQQSVRGERISRGYKNRTLPHFKPGDIGSKARGFVESSFRKGLAPIEFFFHASGGREGLVDTAVRTSTSGYMQRRLINALQDLKAEYDGTIRNAIGDIIQFKFGEDGIDPSKSDYGKAVDVDMIIENFVLTKRKEKV